MSKLKLICSTALFAACLSSGFAPAYAQTRVALELVLAVDASSSVDAQEYRLQVDGYVRAFRDPDVIAAIQTLGSRGIAVTYVEWSSRFRQVQSVGWTHMHDAQGSHAFARAIAENANQLQASGTALGEAVIYSVDLFDGNGFAGDRRTIDVSADDRYNAGSSPTYARTVAEARQITVNGLAIDETGELTAYFADNVITGPDAFVITARSYDDFATALKHKLLRELGEPKLARAE
ncbi:MAG: DUF1194 domain-containing protein [Hyphomicrobiaceae bacterium]